MVSLNAGGDKAQLLRIYEELLLDGILPFWQRLGVDEEYGGVLSCMTEEGLRSATDKYIWSQARWVWVCAAVHNRVEARPDLLAHARKTIDFLLAHARDDRGRWVYRTTREGSVLEGATSIYSDCFVIYGISEYCRAVDDPDLLRFACETFAAVQRRVEDPEFADTVPYPLGPNRRNHGVPMILTETAGELAVTTGDPAIEAAAGEYAARIMGHFVRPQRECLLELLDLDYREVPAPEGTLVLPGHAIESMWFVLHRARRCRDKALMSRAAKVLRWHLEKGWDAKFGGLFLAIDIEGRPPAWNYADAKLWWPHTEALYALLLAYELTGERWCLDWYRRVHDWSFAHFPMPGTGEWRQRLNRSGEPIDDVIALPVKDPFHLPRTAILIIDLLRNRSTRELL